MSEWGCLGSRNQAWLDQNRASNFDLANQAHWFSFGFQKHVGDKHWYGEGLHVGISVSGVATRKVWLQSERWRRKVWNRSVWA